jgi:4-hydroxybenzoate polyprenyltransferase
MNKTILVSLIYILGVLIGAFFLKIWGAETSFIKTISIFVWTIIFLILLFYADKKEREKIK